MEFDRDAQVRAESHGTIARARVEELEIHIGRPTSRLIVAALVCLLVCWALLARMHGVQELQWTNGTTLKIPGVFVDNGTTPKGSTWAMNPIPRIDFDSKSSGQPAGYTGCKMVNGEPVGPNCRQFDPPCSWDHGWFAQPPRKKPRAAVDVNTAQNITGIV